MNLACMTSEVKVVAGDEDQLKGIGNSKSQFIDFLLSEDTLGEPDGSLTENYLSTEEGH